MKLTPFHQEQPHTCLPACIRIVLDYWGRNHIVCVDPSLGAEVRLKLDAFWRAWAALDNQGMAPQQ